MSPESVSELIIVIASIVAVAGCLTIALGALYQWRSRSKSDSKRLTVLGTPRQGAPSDRQAQPNVGPETPAKVRAPGY